MNTIISLKKQVNIRKVEEYAKKYASDLTNREIFIALAYLLNPACGEVIRGIEISVNQFYDPEECRMVRTVYGQYTDEDTDEELSEDLFIVGDFDTSQLLNSLALGMEFVSLEQMVRIPVSEQTLQNYDINFIVFAIIEQHGCGDQSHRQDLALYLKSISKKLDQMSADERRKLFAKL